ncbi:NfeD family protein [Sphingomonas immobilis]|uniref:NfeD family protein n=1 Tax=Sphingomonas immobilis TaxID=3063997 RepID=A0ABT8ZYU5_9SPHN|nr:NfeD family protein [Sphingomonas sp. CA1-15]MDO7842753.1 NfeD family protein [Sphingomonas sp. CA1-15]
MTLGGVLWTEGALWFAAAILFVIAEMLAPGFFLIFLAAGAAVTGVVVLVAPGLPVLVQALIYCGFTAVAVAIGWRWYMRAKHAMPGDPLLNDRTARLIGKQVEVCEAIVGGSGRVTVGDGAWNAEGPDAPAGTRMRVTGANGNVLLVEPA